MTTNENVTSTQVAAKVGTYRPARDEPIALALEDFAPEMMAKAVELHRLYAAAAADPRCAAYAARLDEQLDGACQIIRIIWKSFGHPDYQVRPLVIKLADEGWTHEA